MKIPQMTTYEEAVRNFRLELPETFNFGRDVVDSIAESADRLALLWTSDEAADRRFAFSDISRLSNRLANLLSRAGIRKGDRIIVQLPRIPEWHLMLTACTKIGAVPIPCIEMLTAKDLQYRISHSGAIAAITTPENTPKYEGCAGLRLKACFGKASDWLDLHEEAERESDSHACAEIAIEDPAIMYYTSGSTGNPKGVIHAARALFAWKLSSAYWQRIGAGDLNWCTADTGWSKAGTGSLFSPWGMGSAVMAHNGAFDPRRRLELIETHGVTVFCAAATEFRHMLQLDLSRYDFSKLRLCVSGGESVNPEVVNRWRDITGVNLLDGYGQTETLMTILNYAPMGVKPGSMGRPIPGTQFEVLGDDNERVGTNGVGHIAMRLPNPQFMLGYWKEPEKTAEKIVKAGEHDFWLTGDMGYRDEDGYYFYTGRSDDIISSAGYRIGPTEVENALSEHPSVLEAAVVGKPDAERGEIVKAFIVLRKGFAAGPALISALQDHVKKMTAPYKYPREIEFIAEIPKTPSGKMLRRVLRDAEAKRHSSRTFTGTSSAQGAKP